MPAETKKKTASAKKPSKTKTAVKKPVAKKSAAKKTVTKKTARKVQKARKSMPKTKSATVKSNPKKQTERVEAIMTKGPIQFDKFAQDAANAGKENMDAMMQSGNIFMNGFEEIIKTCMTMTQQTADKNTKAMKSLMGCKTLNDLTEAQTKIARQNFEDFVAGTTKISELSMKVATDSFAPLNVRMGDTAKKARESMAA